MPALPSDPALGASSAGAAVPRRVDRLLAHYASSHQNPRNELIHFIAIPLIALSLLGLLFALHPLAAIGFVVASLVYYARLSAVFLISMTIISALMLTIVWALSAQVLRVSIAVFIGAWLLQFIGHKIEGKKPSFLEDIQYLWVGPLFVLSKLFVKLGVRW